MKASFTFRNLESTEALKAHAIDRLGRIARYLDQAGEAHVTLSLERHHQVADISVDAGRFHLRGKERSADLYASIDAAVDKIERQLKRYKDKLKNHKPAHVHAHEPLLVRYEVFSARPEEGEGPEVIRANEFLAKPMSVEEAVMQMDLMNNDFLVFRNATSQGVNVVYRRTDGNYGLIDAANGQPAAALAPKP